VPSGLFCWVRPERPRLSGHKGEVMAYKRNLASRQ